MSQQVTVTSNTQIQLKPLVEAAIRSEVRMLELGLERTRERLRLFEKRYHLSSTEFIRRFSTGESGESLDFIEWAGEAKTYELVESQLRALQEAQIS
ncbi:MAG: hypothetical protein U0641_11675 [Anaerolineae bacterium]